MITLDKFMRGVDEIIDSKPVYKSGGDGRAGECDCIGLIIGAIRRAGGTWSSTHGSNYAARNEMQDLATSPTLEIGLAMYKYYEPGEAGWNLPASYKNHPDQRDYYHVGVVISVSPLEIAHCTSWSGGSGIKIDTVIGKWRRGGRLKKVGYVDAPEPGKKGAAMTGYINLPSDTNVFLRIKPNDKSDWFARIPGQSAVEVISSSENWSRVRWGGFDGYVAKEFITAESAPYVPAPDPPAVEAMDIVAMMDEIENNSLRNAALSKAIKAALSAGWKG